MVSFDSLGKRIDYIIDDSSIRNLKVSNTIIVFNLSIYFCSWRLYTLI